MSALRWRSAYRRDYTPLADGSWYWHLYWKDEHVNGGLSESRECAIAAAEYAISCDMRGTAVLAPWVTTGILALS